MRFVHTGNVHLYTASFRLAKMQHWGKSMSDGIKGLTSSPPMERFHVCKSRHSPTLHTEAL